MNSTQITTDEVIAVLVAARVRNTVSVGIQSSSGQVTVTATNAVDDRVARYALNQAGYATRVGGYAETIVTERSS